MRSNFGFELRLAIRHLRAGGGQTLLTISTVVAGVVVIIFISSLILGLRQMFTNLLTDLIPQVTVRPVETKPEPATTIGGHPVAARIVAQNPQRKMIDNWQEVCSRIQRMPHVSDVAPAIVDQAFASYGGKQLGATVYGADPEALSRVMNVRKYIVEGHYVGLASGEVVLVKKLANELGVKLGDRVRLTSNQGVTSSFQIVGIYDNGSDEALYCAYTNLRAAQALYRTGSAVKGILVRTDNLFNADLVGDEIAAVMPYKVDTWSRQNPQFLTSLNMQAATVFMICGFTLIAAGFAIASVQVVSVLRKAKQIGILKSMGATQNQIFRMFLLEGFGIAALGAGVGAILGVGFVEFLLLFKRPVHSGLVPDSLFPAIIPGWLIFAAVGAAMVSTIVASALPAKRAAALDPVQVMR